MSLLLSTIDDTVGVCVLRKSIAQLVKPSATNRVVVFACHGVTVKVHKSSMKKHARVPVQQLSFASLQRSSIVRRATVNAQRNQIHVSIQPNNSTNKHANVNVHELRSVLEVKSSITKHVSVNVLHPNRNAQGGKVSTLFLVNVNAQTNQIAALIRTRFLTITRAVANVLAIRNALVHKSSTNRLVSVSVQNQQLNAH